jgi:peptidylprolyl isomerase
MAGAKEGDVVKVLYAGKLEDGTVVSRTPEGESLQFTIGDGKMMPGFEKAVIGMNPGEKKTVDIKAEDGFGPYEQALLLEVQRSEWPDDIEPKIGEQLELERDDGHKIVARITGITDDIVTLDANHPLAGTDLVFDIELESIA